MNRCSRQCHHEEKNGLDHDCDNEGTRMAARPMVLLLLAWMDEQISTSTSSSLRLQF